MEIVKQSMEQMEQKRLLDASTEPQAPPDPAGPEPAIGWADALGEHVQNPPEARTEGRKLFEPDGTVHVVSPCENRIKAQFELWVQNNALQAIAQVEASGNIERADRMMSTYMGDHGAGHYTWEGKHVRSAYLTSVPGISHLIYLLMIRSDPKITEDKVMDLIRKHPQQCGELLRLSLGNSQPPASTGANGTARQRITPLSSERKTTETLD